jgi:membrane protein YdbS with pleckstrin-like domain
MHSLASLSIFTAGGSTSDLRISGLPRETAVSIKEHLTRETAVSIKEHLTRKSDADA